MHFGVGTVISRMCSTGSIPATWPKMALAAALRQPGSIEGRRDVNLSECCRWGDSAARNPSAATPCHTLSISLLGEQVLNKKWAEQSWSQNCSAVFSVANKLLEASDVQATQPLSGSLDEPTAEKHYCLILWASFLSIFAFVHLLRFPLLDSDQSKFRTVGRDICCCMHTINNDMRQAENNAQQRLFHHFKCRNILWQQLNSETNIKETILNESETV